MCLQVKGNCGSSGCLCPYFLVHIHFPNLVILLQITFVIPSSTHARFANCKHVCQLVGWRG